MRLRQIWAPGLRALRRVLRHWLMRIERHLADDPPEYLPEVTIGYDRALRFLLSLRLDENAQSYLMEHLHRVARTVSILPRPMNSSRVLELGCYMQMTPALQLLAGFAEVRGAYFGEAGKSEVKWVEFDGKRFACTIDLLDAERDVFPYRDNAFELVLACEIIEHLRRDPMHLLIECHRVLEEGGILILTTPNCASLTSLARLLIGERNPGIFSRYPHPEAPAHDPAGKHIREYTPWELRELLDAAGFHVETLFTEEIPGLGSREFAMEVLERFGLPSQLRGEQIYCIARKRPEAGRERFPDLLYS